MRLVLFRHGPAGRRDPRRWKDDGLRPLTARGAERTRAAASGLKKILGVDRITIVTSPLTRCVQTAAIVSEVLGVRQVSENKALSPGGSYHPIFELLADRKPGETLVLVGHEPDLGKFVGTALFAAPRGLPMRKSGACVLRFTAAIEPGAAQLEGFYPPRILRRFAGKKARA
jgi:phosphohistidine phosphatase